ncbi:MAG: D-erythronate dehydrogenase, partial [Paracoccaceae bacterium]
MRVMITGGGGFLGVKLAKALAKKGEIRGKKISHLIQADLFKPEPVAADFKVEGLALDIGDRAAMDAAFATPPDAVFHLAAVVSGQAEADFDIGLRVNLFGTINLLEAARAAGNRPIIVYTSSVAVYGGEIPEMIEDWTILNPQTSYGAQKAAGEMLVTDYSRKGFIDGRGLRLPTVTVRPGKPNAAASSFMSSIFREPLQGESANCPVSEDYPIWNSAPRTVVANLVHAAEVPEEDWGQNRCLALPGQTNTVREM